MVLTNALRAVGMRVGDAVTWAEEMRLGLHGRVRRRWTPRGVKLRQPVAIRSVWRSLAVAVEPPAGRLHWHGVERVREETVVGHPQAEGVAAVVLDTAPSHTAKVVRGVGRLLIGLPAHAPELNLAERGIHGLRRAVEDDRTAFTFLSRWTATPRRPRSATPR